MDIKDAGDPVSLAQRYSDQGADELVFLDITASGERRKTIKELVRSVASVIDIPFTVRRGRDHNVRWAQHTAERC